MALQAQYNHTLVYCTWEYETTIVVCVLTDKVNTSCRCKELTLCLEKGLEFFSNFLFHFIVLLVLILLVKSPKDTNYQRYCNTIDLFYSNNYRTMVTHSSKISWTRICTQGFVTRIGPVISHKEGYLNNLHLRCR